MLMVRHYLGLGAADLVVPLVKFASKPIRSSTQIWVVTHHQHGVSVLVSQRSFHGETVSGVADCHLFSQATLLVQLG